MRGAGPKHQCSSETGLSPPLRKRWDPTSTECPRRESSPRRPALAGGCGGSARSLGRAIPASPRQRPRWSPPAPRLRKTMCNPACSPAPDSATTRPGRTPRQRQRRLSGRTAVPGAGTSHRPDLSGGIGSQVSRKSARPDGKSQATTHGTRTPGPNVTAGHGCPPDDLEPSVAGPRQRRSDGVVRGPSEGTLKVPRHHQATYLGNPASYVNTRDRND